MKKIIIILFIILLSSCDTAKNRYYTQMIINATVIAKQKPIPVVKDTIVKKN